VLVGAVLDVVVVVAVDDAVVVEIVVEAVDVVAVVALVVAVVGVEVVDEVAVAQQSPSGRYLPSHQKGQPKILLLLLLLQKRQLQVS